MSAYSDTVLADSPIAYWRFGDTSAPYTDEAGTADLTVAGGAPVAGATGALLGDADTAASFDGVDDYLSHDVADWSGAFAFEVWVKPLSAAVDFDGAFSSTADATNGSFQVDFDGTGALGVTIADDSGAAFRPRFGTPAVGTWAHIAVTVDSTGGQLYYNGAAVGSKVTTWTSGTFGAYRFGVNRGGANFGNVALDEAAIYPALTATEIADHYDIGVNGPPFLGGPIAPVSEATGAQPLGRLKRKVLGVAVDTSAARPLAKRKVKALGVATETATARAIVTRPRIIVGLGIATEATTAGPFTVSQRYPDFFFTPPVRWVGNGFMGEKPYRYYRHQVSMSVVYRNGHYQEVRVVDDTGLTEGDTWFPGGRTHQVTTEQKLLLEADGFTVDII